MPYPSLLVRCKERVRKKNMAMAMAMWNIHIHNLPRTKA